TGKRRFSQTTLPSKKPQQEQVHTMGRKGATDRKPFIKHRDPRYKRFFPGVHCVKCGKVGHYARWSGREAGDCTTRHWGIGFSGEWRVCQRMDRGCSRDG
ncbi:hypothetical protein ADUPG1_002944, partial [Aduncisulcus paluster]